MLFACCFIRLYTHDFAKILLPLLSSGMKDMSMYMFCSFIIIIIKFLWGDRILVGMLMGDFMSM